MNFLTTISQGIFLPVGLKDICKSLSKVVDRIVGVEMIFFELLEDDQNEEIKEDVLADNDEGDPKW